MKKKHVILKRFQLKYYMYNEDCKYHFRNFQLFKILRESSNNCDIKRVVDTGGGTTEILLNSE